VDDLSRDLIFRCVLPFYLSLMRTNASDRGFDLGRLSAVSAETTNDEVIALLRADWRPRVMGAWLSIGRTDEPVTTALLESLETSQGSLTAPPLAVAAVFNASGLALPSLLAYVEKDREHHWGAASFVDAAIAHISESSESAGIDSQARASLTQMLDVAADMARAFRTRSSAG